MVRNKLDLEQKDDWLEKERLRESRISAWDFDEGKKLRSQHEDDCDRQANAAFHEKRHQKRMKVDLAATGERSNSLAGDILWLVIDIILLFFTIFFASLNFRGVGFYIAPAVLFLGINPGIFFWIFVRRRFAPAAYWKLLFTLTLLIELYALVNSSIGGY